MKDLVLWYLACSTLYRILNWNRGNKKTKMQKHIFSKYFLGNTIMCDQRNTFLVVWTALKAKMGLYCSLVDFVFVKWDIYLEYSDSLVERLGRFGTIFFTGSFSYGKKLGWKKSVCPQTQFWSFKFHLNFWKLQFLKILASQKILEGLERPNLSLGVNWFFSA